MQMVAQQINQIFVRPYINIANNDHHRSDDDILMCQRCDHNLHRNHTTNLPYYRKWTVH